LDEKPVYVGKSINMLMRMAQHYEQIAKPRDHKYRVLSEARRKGHRIRFDVLHYATATTRATIEEEIGEREGFYIR
jgi:hypothetical protein